MQRTGRCNVTLVEATRRGVGRDERDERDEEGEQRSSENRKAGFGEGLPRIPKLHSLHKRYEVKKHESVAKCQNMPRITMRI